MYLETAGETVKTTQTLCSVCGRRLTAEIVRRGRELHMLARCPEHGETERLFKKDAGFYLEVSAIADERPDVETTIRPQCAPDAKLAKIIAIDLTENCNLDCPVCFANANASRVEPLASDFILGRLSEIPSDNLEVTLLGGEPTLRPDLPHLVEKISDMGFRVKLITNGLKLQDRAFAQNLRDHGLEWLILQFDGFNPEAYKKLRGLDLMDRKLKILDQVGELGYKVCLATMIVQGVNDDQLGELVRFSFQHHAVRHLALLPASPMGRNKLGLDDSHLHAEDVIDLLNRQTGGRITRDDFLSTMRVMKGIHRVTGHIDFKQRVCFFSLPLLGDPDDFVPAVRLLRPTEAHKHLRFWSKASFIFSNLFSIDHAEIPEHFLYVSIEKLYGTHGIDLEDAGQCNTLYLTRDGLTPSCIYNAMYRGNSPSCGSY